MSQQQNVINAQSFLSSPFGQAAVQQVTGALANQMMNGNIGQDGGQDGNNDMQ